MGGARNRADDAAPIEHMDFRPCDVLFEAGRLKKRGPSTAADGAIREMGVIVTRILIAFGTTEGHSAKIADYIAEVVRSHGIEADVVDVKRSGNVHPDRYNAIIVGGSIHMGKHGDHVRNFVERNRAVLDRLPSALFSVSLAASGDLENAQAYVDNFTRETGWHPAQVGLFAGALLYTQYGLIKRYMMKRIVRDKPGALSTDTSRDYVYTDWDAVKRFSEKFLEGVVQQTEGARRS